MDLKIIYFIISKFNKNLSVLIRKDASFAQAHNS